MNEVYRQPMDRAKNMFENRIQLEATPKVNRLLAVLEGELGRAEFMATLGLKDEKLFVNASASARRGIIPTRL